jgi:hypothetical protein
VETALLLKEAAVKCDQILRYQQLIALRQAQEEEIAERRVQLRKPMTREGKEVYTS